MSNENEKLDQEIRKLEACARDMFRKRPERIQSGLRSAREYDPNLTPIEYLVGIGFDEAEASELLKKISDVV